MSPEVVEMTLYIDSKIPIQGLSFLKSTQEKNPLEQILFLVVKVFILDIEHNFNETRHENREERYT